MLNRRKSALADREKSVREDSSVTSWVLSRHLVPDQYRRLHQSIIQIQLWQSAHCIINSLANWASSMTCSYWPTQLLLRLCSACAVVALHVRQSSLMVHVLPLFSGGAYRCRPAATMGMLCGHTTRRTTTPDGGQQQQQQQHVGQDEAQVTRSASRNTTKWVEGIEGCVTDIIVPNALGRGGNISTFTLTMKRNCIPNMF